MTQIPEMLNRAVKLHREGHLAPAAELYRQILQIEPANSNSLHLLGLISRDQGDPNRAADLFSQAITSDPTVAPFRLNRGLSLRSLGRLDEALDDFAHAIRLDPSLVEAHHQKGNVLKQLGKLEEAVAVLRATVKLAPSLAPAWLNLGVALLQQGNASEAIIPFQQAIALESNRPAAHNILGVALLSAGQVSAAREAFNAALRINPDFAPAHDNLGRLSKSEGQLDDAILHFRSAIAAQPNSETHSNLLLALNYTPNITPEEILAEHRRWNELYASPLTQAATPVNIAPPNGRRIRVGYVSPDFNHHAVAYFLAPVLSAHDHSRFEVFCYSNVISPDQTTARFRGLAEHWRDIARLDDDAAAALVRSDEIDLLIDLSGHTAGNRLLLFARRPAAVQATWLGYPNTTGLDAIDYRLTDAISDPPRETDALYSEKLVRLSSTFSCYEPDPKAPAVNTLPALDSGVFTFASFNNFAKITSEVVQLWARLLKEIPSSTLLLKSRGLGDPSVAHRIRSLFADTGIEAHRIILNGEELSVTQHLSLYHKVDIALDPFPYNGTTTTCEALWMGIPVITLAGRSHAARVGVSVLTHIGLPKWIAATPADYVRIATSAANDLPELAALRYSLRERMYQSSLCNAERFTRELEGAFVKVITRGTA